MKREEKVNSMADPEQVARLKRSVQEWNAWKQAPYFQLVDLSGAILDGADLRGANLIGVDLNRASLNRTNCRGADLRRADLRGTSFDGADLGGADLGEAMLSEANLRSTDLRGADLKGADLRGTSLKGANLRGASLRGASLEEADLGGASLDGADLGDVDLSKTRAGAASPNAWYGQAVAVGERIVAVLVTVSSLAQGVEAVRQWWIASKHTHTSREQTSFQLDSSLPSATDIVAIRLRMTSGPDHEYVEWLTDPERLRTYIHAFQEPYASIRPLHAIFVKRNGDEVKANVVQEMGNDQLETLLSYLKRPATVPASHPSLRPDWRMLVKEEGNDLLVGEASRTAIIQGLHATEQQWRRQQKQKRQGNPPVSSYSSSSASPSLASKKDITDICLVSDGTTRQWIADPDNLNKQIKALNNASGHMKLSQAIFLKREGRTLVMNVTNEKKTHHQPNVILKYLEADPQ